MDDRRARGRSLVFGFQMAKAQAQAAWDARLAALRASIDSDLDELRAELATARAEIERLRSLRLAAGLDRPLVLH